MSESTNDLTARLRETPVDSPFVALMRAAADALDAAAEREAALTAELSAADRHRLRAIWERDRALAREAALRDAIEIHRGDRVIPPTQQDARLWSVLAEEARPSPDSEGFEMCTCGHNATHHEPPAPGHCVYGYCKCAAFEEARP